MSYRGRRISKEDKAKIESMSKKQLGSFIMRENKNSGKFSYAVQTLVKKRKW
jgi:hypothetical protein